MGHSSGIELVIGQWMEAATQICLAPILSYIWWDLIHAMLAKLYSLM